MTDRRTRRGVLASAAALAGALAGCATPVGSQRAGTTTATPAGDDPEVTATPRSSPAGDGRGSVYTRVYRETVDSVVLIRAFTPEGAGQGSGFVYPRRGLVLTNQHVVADADALEVRFSGGEWRTGEVVGADVYSDLAVVRVPDPPSYAAPLSLVEESPVIGQRVVAIGNPFGFEKSLSAGIVSGVNRAITTRGGFTIPDAIQTDAAVNPGNSGGPLVTLDGRVAGVIRSGGGENIGFAVSAALVERIVPALIERGEYEHPFLGVLLSTVTPTVARANGLEEARGVLVVEVLDDGPAAGVLQGSPAEERVNGVEVPVGGDVIVAIDGEPIPTVGALSRYLALETRPDETIDATVVREGTRRTLEVTLGARPPPGRV